MGINAIGDLSAITRALYGKDPSRLAREAADEPTKTRPVEESAHAGNDRETAAAKSAAARAQELRELQDLRARDRTVRSHERAHLAVAGALAKIGAVLDKTRGLDGRFYAVGGEVRLDTSAVPGDAQATAEKARHLHRAATAPANPSTQDQRVAGQATAMERQAQRALIQQRLVDRAEVDQAAARRRLAQMRAIRDDGASETGGETAPGKRVSETV